MKKHLTQQQRSVLAIVMTGAFLLTGKLFIWKSDKPATAQPDTQPVAEIPEPAVTTAPPVYSEPAGLTELTYGTEETVLVPIEPHTDTETVPEPIQTEALTDAAASVTTAAEQTAAPVSETTVLPATTAAPAVMTEMQTEPPAAPAAAEYFKDTLFIGDSRTVGLASYAPIEGVTYYATVGLSTYKIDKDPSQAPDTKGMTFSQILTAKSYSKVYIMLGINELGNDFDYTMQHYSALIDRVRQAHPKAIVILEANLHVAYSRSATDPVINNTVINNFNAELAALADGTNIFYQDVNPFFDDENGCLKEDYTSDGTHPYAKYYLSWSEWLQSHPITG